MPHSLPSKRPMRTLLSRSLAYCSGGLNPASSLTGQRPSLARNSVICGFSAANSPTASATLARLR